MMKKFILISIVLFLIVGYNFISCRQKTPSPEKAIAQILLTAIDSFDSTRTSLQSLAESRQADPKNLQNLFLQTRLAYKNFEWAAEYFEPATSRFVNGPPVPEVEISGEVFQPAGLQVIEGLLFPKYDTGKRQELIQQLKALQLACVKYKRHFENIDIFDWQVLDAAKLEVFRIITLGLSGFDNPLTLESMQESAMALKSLEIVLDNYINKNDTEKLKEKLDTACRYLEVNNDFNLFNRAEFITVYCNPVTISITNLEDKLKIHAARYNRLLNQDVKTLFDKNAFNVDAYAPDASSFITCEKIILGKELFSDPTLSGNGTRSCQSCHQPQKAFTDGLVKNTVIGNNKLLSRNTPTLINSALQPSLFYDLRVDRLEEQSRTVVQSIEEMHGSMQASVKNLWKNMRYRQMFSTAFPKKDHMDIDTLEVMNAIGSYVRSLVFLNSRFDDYMQGNKQAMSVEEISGFNLFMGKAKCGTCHYMPLFNGTFPPRYMKIESEVIGVPQSATNNVVDSDMGRYNIVRAESNKHAFKIPTVRNASLTAPYMHNGAFHTLKQVIDFYDKGGAAGLGLKINNQTLPPENLRLSEQEKTDVIAFINSLESKF